MADPISPIMRALDLFCGDGGASEGYRRAGFQVTGVDIKPHPRYRSGTFVQADAIEYAKEHGHEFDVIVGSPPCQGYSGMSACRPGLADEYPRLVEPFREVLIASGKPYVIENVVGAPLIDPIMLCGPMFGLKTYRHRLFESNVALTAPPHAEHTVPTSKAGHWVPGTYISVAGHCAPVSMAREAMGIDWMARNELVEAIPPKYTEHIGRQLIGACA